jgi:CRISPR-associated protein Csm1
MAAEPPPLLSPIEAAIAGLLHDIGKLAQRAHADEGALRAEYGTDALAGTETSILPRDKQARYTHRHALWSDFALKRARKNGLRWPDGLDGERLAAVAVRHHHPRPDDPSDWIVAEADRLASGLERKQKDEEEGAKGLRFREVALRALLPQLDICRGTPPAEPLYHPAEELSPEAMPPRPAAPADQPRRYGLLWAAWEKGFLDFGRHGLSPARFEQALLGLSERLLWAVPSSTVDQPDVSLHDHARAVAAIAAALAAWHAAHGATSEAAVRDRERPKFRLVTLDLSGIQSALFRLASAKGAGRILRARSFLMGWTVEAALHLLLERLGLPRSSVLLSAGGKAEILAADVPDFGARLEEVRGALDAWMIEHWQGDLALVLAAGPAFPASEFLRRGTQGEVAEGYRQARERLSAALDAAKLAPFSCWRGAAGLVGTGVIPAPFERAEGACASCGVRPAVVQTALDGAWRCRVCDAAYRLGQGLPHADGVAMVGPEAPAAEVAAALPGGLALVPRSLRGPEALTSVTFARGDAGSAVFRAPAHVPRVEDRPDPRDDHAGVEPDERGALGELMSFAQIAARALEVVEGRILGRDLLGIVKADVDRLGEIFGRGLGQDRSPARVAQLSRLMDGYFSERLPWLLGRDFPATYTVYAGGDDLLLVAPWRDALPLALCLREDFGAFAGGNPNLTLSAGIAFVHPKHPLALAVEEAEEALGQAKAAGRDRLGLFGRCLGWAAARETLDLAEALNAELRAGTLPPTFLHRMRWFAARRARAEKGEARAADWNAKWQYHRARFLERGGGAARDRLDALLRRALPPPGQDTQADPEVAMTIALWRNR